MPRRSGFTAILILLLLLALGITGFLVYQNYQLKQKPNSPLTNITPTPDPTAIWQTYTLGKYTYKMPPTFLPNPYINSDVSMSFESQEFSQMKLILILEGAGYGIECADKIETKQVATQTQTIPVDVYQGIIPGKSVMCIDDTSDRLTLLAHLNGVGTDFEDIVALEFTTKEIDQRQATQLFNQILSTFRFVTSAANIPTDWKTFSHTEFTFKYPPQWYWQEASEYPGGDNISFFLVGTIADESFGDHRGNEIFFLEFGQDQRTLEEIKREYYPEATDVYVGGRPAIKISPRSYYVKPSSETKLSLTGREEVSDYIESIITSFSFRKQ